MERSHSRSTCWVVAVYKRKQQHGKTGSNKYRFNNYKNVHSNMDAVYVIEIENPEKLGLRLLLYIHSSIILKKKQDDY